MSAGRKLANGRQSPTSPLKIFGQAKKKINDIFIEIATYINEGNEFVKSLSQESSLIKPDQCEQFSKYKDKVQGIREILKRDRMKVAFFGRTSNGKSSVINAMLRNKILPSGIGHTTNCFLQVEGVEGQEAYLINEQDQQKLDLQAGPLKIFFGGGDDELNNDTLIRICWPKDQCTLLRDDVVLVDSPGIDVSPDLDSWIDKFCLDADVFVLVANAESTLMQTEKNFFHRVSERLSKPNIFILNNRWDASASELEMMQEVKQQHLERNVEFLVDELKVATHHEAENRVFFVSAREALASRINQDRGTPTPTNQMLEGFQGRLFEFASFERKFEECISQSAVETKFALHADNGKEITRYMYKTMENICLSAVDSRSVLKEEYDSRLNHLMYTDQQMVQLTAIIRDKIKRMTEEVEVKVSTALSEEIRRLSTLVDEFDEIFNSDPISLHDYKKKLHSHVEAGLSTNLQSRCSEALRSAVDQTSNDMAEQLLVLIPDDSRRKTIGVFPSRNFEMAYRLDCRNLCAEFCEDIDFRFSLGMSTLVKRFAGIRYAKPKLITRTLAYPADDVTNSPQNRGMQSDDNELMVSLLSAFSSLYSGTTIGVLAIAALLGKAAGWRVIGLCGGIYGLLYLYERITWTNSAKEKAFKRQYVDYASGKLRLIVDLTSANCSHQVQQELNSTFGRLCQQVEMTKNDLEDELKNLEVEITKLDEASKQAICLKNKTQFVDTELSNFMLQYLKPLCKL
ncbi:hypothetical protein HELRODRAFT_87998 [Helobdella robusta]|uniref:Dynamin-type G domain-containing protein n=1 Tax=Helobdella robusta TaxID=6412 RepID=T1G6X2_HELRO|nr:hypothetical protein HELRODRAFT_87998 [Helobdella robusta]ESN93802.1 hypothetical protein HELRODRAFT_87998 [Helobdella robusta]